MFETLFGSGMPLAARFFIAFLVVLALIGLTAWLVRRFGANRLGGGAARGRQPRLAVIDAASVDGRRRLVLIRRDNVEHLLMIGGPTDVVVEPNIVRANAAREPGRTAPEVPVRGPVPVENAWPLQPLSEPAPSAQSRSFRGISEEPWFAPEAGARPRPTEGYVPPDLPPRVASDFAPARQEPRAQAAESVNPPGDHNLADMAQQLEAALRRSPMPEGRPPVTDPLAASQAKSNETPRAPLREFKPRLEPKFELKAEPKAETKAEPRFEPKIDSKLESSTPEAKVEPKLTNPEPKFDAKPEPKVEPKFEPEFEPKFEPKFEAKPESRFEPKFEPKFDAKPEAKSEPAPPKTIYDSLEEEMASLLGRPSGKP